MRPIPIKLRKKINEDPYYKVCARNKEGFCSGRITIEHAFIYARKQISEVFSLIPLCWFHHLGAGLDKRKNQWIAINRATPADFARYPKKDWNQIKEYLNKIYASS